MGTNTHSLTQWLQFHSLVSCPSLPSSQSSKVTKLTKSPDKITGSQGISHLSQAVIVALTSLRIPLARPNLLQAPPGITSSAPL